MARLRAAVEANPELEVTIDVVGKRIEYGGEGFAVTIPESAREALVSGHWDAIADLIEGMPRVEATAGALAYMAR
jgi:3-isopropylmalate/(R)-2-methylmalate dehydratase small subunit